MTLPMRLILPISRNDNPYAAHLTNLTQHSRYSSYQSNATLSILVLPISRNTPYTHLTNLTQHSLYSSYQSPAAHQSHTVLCTLTQLTVHGRSIYATLYTVLHSSLYTHLLTQLSAYTHLMQLSVHPSHAALCTSISRNSSHTHPTQFLYSDTI